MVRTISILAALGLGVSACDYPRDIEGTRDAIAARGEVRVGLARLHPAEEDAARRFLTRIGTVTGARVETSAGTSDELFARLEAGELDLVLGEFAVDSPWLDEVALIEPIASRVVGEREVGLAPVARNGENAWIGVIEREVRDMRGGR